MRSLNGEGNQKTQQPEIKLQRNQLKINLLKSDRTHKKKDAVIAKQIVSKNIAFASSSGIFVKKIVGVNKNNKIIVKISQIIYQIFLMKELNYIKEII